MTQVNEEVISEIKELVREKKLYFRNYDGSLVNIIEIRNENCYNDNSFDAEPCAILANGAFCSLLGSEYSQYCIIDTITQFKPKALK